MLYSCCTRASRANRQGAASATHVSAACCFSWARLGKNRGSHDPFPSGPMKSNRQPIRCTCITQPGSEGCSTAVPAPILRCCCCCCCCCRCYRHRLVCCQLHVLVFVFGHFLVVYWHSRRPSDNWNADAGFSLLVLKIKNFDDLSCSSLWLCDWFTASGSIRTTILLGHKLAGIGYKTDHTRTANSRLYQLLQHTINRLGSILLCQQQACQQQAYATTLAHDNGK